MDFSQLKKASNLNDITKKVEKLSKGYQKDSDTFWNLTPDKTGNGRAVIRFLPIAPMDASAEALEWVQVFRHSFEGPGGWLIEECPTTIGNPCPVCEQNKGYWSSGQEALKKVASEHKRQLKYISNIYIINDPGNPDNNGKVMLFKYGAKIFKKIQSAMSPEFPEDPAFDPFDFWTGANFVVKKTGVGRDSNYDQSTFQAQSPLFDDDFKIEEVWKQEHSLKAFLDPSIFSSYENIQKRLDRVTGNTTQKPQKESVVDELEKEVGLDNTLGDELDDMKFFESLAQEGTSEVPF